MRVAVLVEPGRIEMEERPAHALDSDRVPGTVKSVVTVS
jgi:hypothetical protein